MCLTPCPPTPECQGHLYLHVTSAHPPVYHELSLRYLWYLIQWKCCVNCCQHTANSNFDFGNFLNFSFFKNTLDGLLVDPAAEPADMRPDWLCLPYSLRWGRLVGSGAWPPGSVGTFLLRGHRARLCLCPGMGSRWAAWKATRSPRRRADCSCTSARAVWRTTDQPMQFLSPGSMCLLKSLGQDTWCSIFLVFPISERLLPGCLEMLSLLFALGRKNTHHNLAPSDGLWPRWEGCNSRHGLDESLHASS